MYNPFLKVKPRLLSYSDGVSFNRVLHPLTKKVLQNGEPTTLTEFVNADIRELKKPDIPNSDNYQLRELLKLGYVPEPIGIQGMLDSNDPLNSTNIENMAAVFTEIDNYSTLQDSEDDSKDNI